MVPETMRNTLGAGASRLSVTATRHATKPPMRASAMRPCLEAKSDQLIRKGVRYCDTTKDSSRLEQRQTGPHVVGLAETKPIRVTHRCGLIVGGAHSAYEVSPASRSVFDLSAGRCPQVELENIRKLPELKAL